MSVDATNLAKLTKEEILGDLIQRELRDSAVLTPLMVDLSSRFAQGVKDVKVPRSLNKTIINTPNDGSEIADTTTEYKEDILSLDQFKTVSDYVYDVDQYHSVVDLKSDFYQEAVPQLAEAIEADMVAQLVLDGTTAPSGGANPNKFQLSGGANDELTIDDISGLNEAMTTAKVPKSERYLMVSPRQARIVRSYSAVRDASAFGNNNSIVNGFIARIEGFDILESTDLTANQVVAFHRNAMAKVMAKEVSIDEERQSTKKRDFLSVDAAYGRKALRDGELIWFGDENA